MKTTLIVTALVIFSLPAWGQTPKIYIAPAEGFELCLGAAIGKKHVNAQVVSDEKQADYTLKTSVIAGDKPAGFWKGATETRAKLIDLKTGVVAGSCAIRIQGRQDNRKGAAYVAGKLNKWLTKAWLNRSGEVQ
jgi:hypothetical protein